MWLDGLYMQGPFYAQYACEYGNDADFDDVAHQFTLMESKARDTETGLLYHAWDESREQPWANPDTGCSPHFWGRALGWYCMALADTLDFIPASCSKQAEALTAIVRRLLAPLLKYQDTQSGLWYQVMDRGQSAGNYPESSASSMFIYFLLKMMRLNKKFNLGLVPETNTEAVKSAAVRAYQGLLEQRVQEDNSGELHLTGTCKVAGLGGTPYRDGSYEYYVNEPQSTDDFKGIGSFILASMEYEDILK
jgi:unsaturated rhamnogalacturonyl hydrolase